MWKKNLYENLLAALVCGVLITPGLHPAWAFAGVRPSPGAANPDHDLTSASAALTPAPILTSAAAGDGGTPAGVRPSPGAANTQNQPGAEMNSKPTPPRTSAAAEDDGTPAEIIVPDTFSPQTVAMAAPTFQRSIFLPSITQPEPTLDDVAKGKLRIGMRRNFSQPVKVSRQTVDEGEWFALEDGSRIWAAQIIAEGAQGMRVHLRDVALPPGATLMVYSPDLSRSGATVDAEQMAEAREIWMPSVLGDTVIFECRAPAELGVKDVSFTLDGVSHLYDSPTPISQKAGACHQDVSCAEGWGDAPKGVGRISFVENGSTYVCTGGLLWDNNGKGRYFLTAKHCIENPAVASTMEVYWFYQTVRCNGPAPALSEATRTAGGADFVAGSSGSDFALVRLRRSPPPGVFYLSWSQTSPSVGERVTTVHHPGGRQKRLSVGTKVSEDANYIRVRWSAGVTEPGSSGAPLFNSRGEVVGQLYGGASSCSNPSGTDIFGRFDVTYEMIKSWLEPGYQAAGVAVKVPKGTFAGLFENSDAPAAGSSGVLTIQVAPKNRFTGNIRMKSGRYGFSGKFDSAGYSQVRVKRARLSAVTLSLRLDSSDTDRIVGEVAGAGWNSGTVANRSVYNGVSSKAPQAGRYTLAIPDTGIGDGYALATVGRNGRVAFTVKVPGRPTASTSGFIAREGDYPMFAPLAGNRELLAGWVAFGAGYWSAPEGAVNWHGPNGAGRSLALSGSRYVPPAASGPVLEGSEASLRFAGGLDAEFTFRLNAKRKAGAGSAGPERISITFNPNGTFKGAATGLVKGRKVPFEGVLLQNSKSGYGAYSGSGYKGAVRLIAN